MVFAVALTVKPVAVLVTMHHAWFETASQAFLLVVTLNVALSVVVPSAAKVMAVWFAGVRLNEGAAACCVTLITIASAVPAVTVTVAGAGAVVTEFAVALTVNPVAVLVTMHHVWLETAFHALWFVVTPNTALSAVVPSAAKAMAVCPAGVRLSVGAAGASSLLHEAAIISSATAAMKILILFVILFLFYVRSFADNFYYF
jgi:hypothetical protein